MEIITPNADQFLIADAPYYEECGAEISIFEAAWKQKRSHTAQRSYRLWENTICVLYGTS